MASNTFQLRSSNLKDFFHLSKIISKYAPEFVDIANKRDIVIKKVFKEFKSTGHIDEHSLSDLHDCIKDEYDLKEHLVHRVNEASLLFNRLHPVALKTFEEGYNSAAWKFKFKSMRFYNLLLKQWPLIRSLFFLFKDYLDHLDVRAAIEKKFIKDKATGMLLRNSELRKLWQKDKDFFLTFSAHIQDLSSIVSELKAANIVTFSLFGLGSAISYRLAFLSSLDEKGFTGWAAIAFIIFMAAAMYNLAVYMTPASKKESDAVSILDSFDKSVERMNKK